MQMVMLRAVLVLRGPDVYVRMSCVTTESWRDPEGVKWYGAEKKSRFTLTHMRTGRRDRCGWWIEDAEISASVSLDFYTVITIMLQYILINLFNFFILRIEPRGTALHPRPFHFLRQGLIKVLGLAFHL